MLSCKGLIKRFGKLALAFPDMEIGLGELVWLKGNSGSGKSTLLHLIAGLLDPDEGTITWGDTSISSLSPTRADRFRAKSVGMIFQQPHLYPALTGRENLSLAGSFSSIGRQKELIYQLGLETVVDQYPSSLSGGQAQRIGVIRGLQHKPPLVLADEPTASLDPENFELVMHAISNHCHENNSAVLLSSHDPRSEKFADRTITLSNA